MGSYDICTGTVYWTLEPISAQNLNVKFDPVHYLLHTLGHHRRVSGYRYQDVYPSQQLGF